jgi:hypothetical protein
MLGTLIFFLALTTRAGALCSTWSVPFGEVVTIYRYNIYSVCHEEQSFKIVCSAGYVRSDLIKGVGEGFDSAAGEYRYGGYCGTASPNIPVPLGSLM